jgi:hypothetical protein
MDNHRASSFFQAVPATPSEEKTIHLGFLNADELSLFSLLIQHRRPLPVYLGGFWRCYACLFESADFAAVAHHIMHAHGPAPYNEEDLLEHAGRAGVR